MSTSAEEIYGSLRHVVKPIIEIISLSIPTGTASLKPAYFSLVPTSLKKWYRRWLLLTPCHFTRALHLLAPCPCARACPLSAFSASPAGHAMRVLFLFPSSFPRRRDAFPPSFPAGHAVRVFSFCDACFSLVLSASTAGHAVRVLSSYACPFHLVHAMPVLSTFAFSASPAGHAMRVLFLLPSPDDAMRFLPASQQATRCVSFPFAMRVSALSFQPPQQATRCVSFLPTPCVSFQPFSPSRPLGWNERQWPSA